MLSLNLFGKNLSLGIQIGEDFIKGAFLKKTGINSYAIPSPPFYRDNLKDEDSKVNAIREEITRRDLKPSVSVLGLSPDKIFFKSLKIPKVEKSELIDAIEWNIREDVATLQSDTIYDFAILGIDENKIMDVLVVIARTQDVNHLIEICKRAGLEIDIVDAEPVALINLAMVYNKVLQTEEENICVIHLDKEESYMTFYHKGISVQPLQFKSRIYETLSPDEKEQAIENLINEINYFFLTIHQPKVIYMSGDSFKFPEIRAYMQLKFGSRSRLEDLDPIKALGIKYEGKDQLGLYNVPIALALRGLKDD